MNLYVIRHGETDWNQKGIMLSIEDKPLNQNGIEQANKAREIVKKLDYDIVISSPLERTYHTAQIVNKNKNIDIVTDKRIMERNAGILSGKSISEEMYKDYWNLEKDIKYEGAETIKEFLDRVYNFLNEIKFRNYLLNWLLMDKQKHYFRTLHKCLMKHIYHGL